MFRIRPELMRAFREQAFKESIARIAGALREKLPEETERYGPGELEFLCDRAIDRAEQYGIGTEYNVYLFTAAMIVYGETFDTDNRTRWCHQSLRNKRVDEDIKAGLLRLHILADTGREL
jgi:hypothetical protein